MARALVWLASAALLTGCGEASSSVTASTRTTSTESASSPTSSTATSTLSAGTVDVVSAARQFRQCLAKAGVTLRHMSNVPGRVPLIRVPADYLGAFANSNQVYDFWIANRPTNARVVAELLNVALSERAGHREERALAEGVLVVAGSGGIETEATAADIRRADAAGACEKALPRPTP